MTTWLPSMALVRGNMEYGPMPVRSSMSKPRISPSRLTAMRALMWWWRAWMSLVKLSSRSATNLTGRPSRMDIATVAKSSG
ncbi:hypothetical protein D9M68_716710 [compost metagenome]